MSGQGDNKYTAREAIEVSDSDVEGVSLVVGPGIDLKGRILVEGNAALNLSMIGVELQPRDEVVFIGAARASIKPDGTFVVPNVADGNYQFIVHGLPEDFYLKAARISGSDVLASNFSVSPKQPPGPLEVVLSPNGGRIDGLVVKEDKPFSGATAVLVPEADRHKEEHLYKGMYSDQEGRFSIRGIPPGDYTLFAWESDEGSAYQDPQFLGPYKDRGKAIHVEEGSQLNSQLELIQANEPAAP